MEHIFETQLEIDRPIDEVFAFFSDAQNLERITPAELRFTILTPMPIAIRQGTLIDYRLRLFGIPIGWRTLISEWNPPHSFTDEQLRGPYAQWIHRHSFEAVGNRTMMRDQVRYRVPLGPFGNLFHPLVRRQVARIFEHRSQAVADAFGL